MWELIQAFENLASLPNLRQLVIEFKGAVYLRVIYGSQKLPMRTSLWIMADGPDKENSLEACR
jgi:hypothetical protein